MRLAVKRRIALTRVKYSASQLPHPVMAALVAAIHVRGRRDHAWRGEMPGTSPMGMTYRGLRA